MSNLSPYLIERTIPSRSVHPDLRGPGLEDGIGLAECWKIIRRRIRLVGVLFFSAMLLAGIGLLLQTPMYTAQANLLIQPETPKVLDIKQLISDSADPNYYHTQYELLKSRDLAEQVIREMDLDHNHEFTRSAGLISEIKSGVTGWLAQLTAPAGEAPVSAGSPEFRRMQALIGLYLSRVKVDPKPETRLVTISFKASDPKLAASILDRHVRDYVRRGLELDNQPRREARKYLEKQLADIGEEVQTSQAALNAYRQKMGILSFEVSDRSSIMVQRMTDLAKALTDAETRRITAESQMQQVRAGDYGSLPQVVNNSAISALKPQVSLLQSEYASMSAAFNPAYPKLAELKAKLTEAQDVLKQHIEEVAKSVERDYKAASLQEQQLRAQVQQEKEHDLALNDASLKDAVLSRQVETHQQLYKNVLQRIQEMGVTDQTPLSNISIVDRAVPPLSPSSPRKGLVLGITALSSLMFGVGLTFLLDHFDDRLKSAEEVESFLHLPNLAVAPDFERLRAGFKANRYLPGGRKQRKAKSKYFPAENGDTYASSRAEVYRTIRTALMFSRAGRAPRTILISSAIPGEGKTWTSVHTAMAFAQTGSSTLLLDADLRRPQSHKLLETQNLAGLSEVLVGQCEAADAIRRIPGSNLSLLSSGQSVPNPAELLISSRMREVLDSLSKMYEFVLIDSAPVMFASDTAGIATMVDGVLVVAGAQTPKQSVRRACERLILAGGKVLGVVLNRIDIREPDHKEHMNYYFSYAQYESEHRDSPPA